MATVTRRRALAMGLTGMAVAPTLGCRSGAGGGQAELDFWTWVPGVDKCAAVWNEKRPDARVRVTTISGGDSSGYPKMFAGLRNGGAPDLAQVEFQMLPSFMLDQGLVNLSEYGADAYRDTYTPWQWEQGVFLGNVHAIPQDSGPMGMFYRADLFEKWGVPVPETWAEFREVAAEIRAASRDESYICTFPPANAAWFTSLCWQAGARWLNTDGGVWTVDISDETTLEVANYWDKMRDDDLCATSPDGGSGWNNALQTGRFATWICAKWGDALIKGNAPDTEGDWKVAPMPQWKAGESASANWGGSTTAVLATTKRPREATEFAHWLNSDPESVRILLEAGIGYPAIADVSGQKQLAAADPFFGGQTYNDVFAEANTKVDVDWQWLPTITSTYQRFNDGFARAAAGRGSFVQVARDVQDDTIADLKAKGLEVRAAK